MASIRGMSFCDWGVRAIGNTKPDVWPADGKPLFPQAKVRVRRFRAQLIEEGERE